MLVHMVLFAPKPDLPGAGRNALGDALATALRTIPSIRRLQVGRRVTHGRPGYEQSMRIDYTYVALIVFDDVGGLHEYLDHPAHAQLAERFFVVVQDALMYDFELRDGESGIRALL